MASKYVNILPASGRKLLNGGKVFVSIFCAFVALVVACIVYKYKSDVRTVCHFTHYDRAASVAATAAHEKRLAETVANVWDFHASAMVAAASSLQVSCFIVSLFNDLEQIVYSNLPWNLVIV
ncbi:hypothetical protein Ddye_015598 [Dipteronia dyeriana]|uniref:Uncharacterized protein n=1 Tax=Dipteronia dyeriana TaxID=168575 RepID=A0AAD9U663_9ROSI|nr:hypothetical protein Ddye_015598 [Dipteronia dyeriana]